MNFESNALSCSGVTAKKRDAKYSIQFNLILFLLFLRFFLSPSIRRLRNENKYKLAPIIVPGSNTYWVSEICCIYFHCYCREFRDKHNSIQLISINVRAVNVSLAYAHRARTQRQSYAIQRSPRYQWPRDVAPSWLKRKTIAFHLTPISLELQINWIIFRVRISPFPFYWITRDSLMPLCMYSCTCVRSNNTYANSVYLYRY